MRHKVIISIFILIGVAIGIILSLQIRTRPPEIGSFPLDQLTAQKAMLDTFSIEQQDLKMKLEAVESALKTTRAAFDANSSKKTLKTLTDLKNLTGFDLAQGTGIRITLGDNPAASRVDFSTIDENFVQASDLRDLANTLFLKDALAVAINGKRITPLTPIQSLFDSILIDNLQTTPPFVIEAIGNPVALEAGIHTFNKRKLTLYIDVKPVLALPSLDALHKLTFTSLVAP